MKKERIKSIVLIMLIITNLVLAEKILVNEKLWLSGYNFFVSARTNRKKNSVSVTESLTMPEKIIVNTGYQSSRFIYRRGGYGFSSINSAAAGIIRAALSDSKSAYSVSAEDWYAVLGAKSLHLSYPVSFPTESFASFYGVSAGELPVSEFSDIAIAENGNVYLGGEGYCKIPVTSSAVSSIIRGADGEHSDDESIINYSFDLFFDRTSGEESTVLSPMILVYSEPIYAPLIIAQNPLLRDGYLGDKPVSTLLPLFGVNKNSARSYTEADGTLVYVENNGILKITPSGILNFTATENGIYLKRGAAAASKTAAFIESVNGSVGNTSDVCLTSLSFPDSSEHFEFDYMVSGYPVNFKELPAISVTVKNGYLTEYTQVLRNFDVTPDMTYSPDFIEALDSVIAKYRGSLSEMRITRMYPAYFDDFGENPLGIDWEIEVDNILAE